MRFAVLGAGALGGYYGARLQKAGHEVHFLLRSDYEAVKRDGLRIRSPDGDFNLPQVSAHRDIASMPPCDAVLLALKTTANGELPALLPPVLAPDGLVFAMQNGFGIEEEVAAAAGADRVMGCLCFIGVSRAGPGLIRHEDYGTLRLGEYRADGKPAGITSRMKAWEEHFRAAGLRVELAEDLLLARWQKLAWNIPFNGLSVALRADTAGIMKAEAGRTLVRLLLGEVARAAALQGRMLSPAFLERTAGSALDMAPYLPSMRQDFDAGRPLEIEALYGRVLRLAEAAGLDLPHLRHLKLQLEFLQG